MKIIEKEEVEKNLTYPICIELMKKAFSDMEKGLTKQVVRTGMGLPFGAFAFMPCYLESNHCFGAKIISVCPGNSKEGFPSHQGYVMLFEAAHGTPVAMVEASAITEIRTGAASAAATDLLARKDAHKLTILGSGAQARSHLAAMTCIRDITNVTVWSYHRENAERFIEEVKHQYACSFYVSTTIEDAVKEADIICSVCRTKDPILKSDWVRPGTHINAVGTCSPISREVDSALVAKSRLYVDQREACEAESGEYLIPLQEGRITKDHILGSIGELINGTAIGREDDKQITLFDSLGIAVEDLICADYLYKKTCHVM